MLIRYAETLPSLQNGEIGSGGRQATFNRNPKSIASNCRVKADFTSSKSSRRQNTLS